MSSTAVARTSPGATHSRRRATSAPLRRPSTSKEKLLLTESDMRGKIEQILRLPRTPSAYSGHQAAMAAVEKRNADDTDATKPPPAKKRRTAPDVHVPEKRERSVRASASANNNFAARQSSLVTTLTAQQQAPAKRAAVSKDEGGPTVLKATGAKGERTASSGSQEGKVTSGTTRTRGEKAAAAVSSQNAALMKASINNKQKKSKADDASVGPTAITVKALGQAATEASSCTARVQTRSQAKAKGGGGPHPPKKK